MEIEKEGGRRKYVDGFIKRESKIGGWTCTRRKKDGRMDRKIRAGQRKKRMEGWSFGRRTD